MRRPLLLAVDIALIAVAGTLAVHLHRVWTAAPVTGPTRPAAPAPTDSPATPAPRAIPARPPLSTFLVVAERNLFNPSRTETPPEAPKAGVGVATAPPAPKPRLYGIVVMPDGRARAYLEDVQRRKVLAYGIGDSVGDSRLEEIKADRVVLRRGSEAYEVLLRDSTKPRPAPTPRLSGSPPTSAGAAPTPGRPSLTPRGAGIPGMPPGAGSAAGGDPTALGGARRTPPRGPVPPRAESEEPDLGTAPDEEPGQ